MHARLRAVALGAALTLCGVAWAAAGLPPEDLPARAQALRDGGVDADQVREAVEAARSAKLSAGEAADLLEASLEPVETHGPVEGFGSFVKEKLDAGLRGPELASAIAAEHEKRGLGKGKPSPTKPAPQATRPQATRPQAVRPNAGAVRPNSGAVRPTPTPAPRAKVKSRFKPPRSR